MQQVQIMVKNVQSTLEKALNQALDEGCDALFFAKNSLGIQSLKILRSIDKRLPSELGIVSFDNPEVFQISDPAITCYEQPMEQMCEVVISLLAARIKGKISLHKSQFRDVRKN